MRSGIGLVWTQLRRIWRPVLAFGVVLIAFGACRHWDPVTETVINPDAARTQQRTAPPQSPHQAHSLAARSG